jgi:hypothetical protein
VLDQVRVHPNGFVIDLEVVFDPRLDVPRPRWQRVYGGTVPRVAVTFADGRRGDNLGQHGGPAVELDERGYPTAPYVAWASTGGVGSQVYRYWVHPLPPSGDVTISVSWESTEIAPSDAVLAGDTLRAAAARAIQLYK